MGQRLSHNRVIALSVTRNNKELPPFGRDVSGAGRNKRVDAGHGYKINKGSIYTSREVIP
jgi:hypothetical protein